MAYRSFRVRFSMGCKAFANAWYWSWVPKKYLYIAAANNIETTMEHT